MKAARSLLILLAACLLALPAAADHRDPLNPAEADQLRDAAQDPTKRVGLYVKFLHARATQLEQLASDPRFTADRNGQIHDQLEDITTLVDEMDGNIDQFAEKFDIRKTLKDVIALDTELEARLRRLKPPAKDGPAGAIDYAFALTNALEAAQGSLDHARTTLADQEDRVKHKK